MRKGRHYVRLRRSYVRYRVRSFARWLWTWSLRLGFLALGLWAAKAGNVFWKTSSSLRVQRVLVDPSAPAALAGQLGVRAGDHLFGFSAKAAVDRLKKIYPELSEIRVRRRWDRGVEVSVRWREPLARVPDEINGERSLGIDREGAIFPLRRPGTQVEKLPVFMGVSRGPSALPALNFLTSLQKLPVPWVRSLSRIKISTAGEAVLFLHDRTAVYWGEISLDEERLRKKAARLERVLKDKSLAGGAEYIRFVSDERLAVKPLTSSSRPAGGEAP